MTWHVTLLKSTKRHSWLSPGCWQSITAGGQAPSYLLLLLLLRLFRLLQPAALQQLHGHPHTPHMPLAPGRMRAAEQACQVQLPGATPRVWQRKHCKNERNAPQLVRACQRTGNAQALSEHLAQVCAHRLKVES
jgi:hypothetical protein